MKVSELEEGDVFQCATDPTIGIFVRGKFASNGEFIYATNERYGFVSCFKKDHEVVKIRNREQGERK